MNDEHEFNVGDQVRVKPGLNAYTVLVAIPVLARSQAGAWDHVRKLLDAVGLGPAPIEDVKLREEKVT